MADAAHDPPGYRTNPLTADLTYIVAARQGRPNLPATGCPFCVGGLEAPEPYHVVAFENRWPAFPGGRCEVVLYTSDHDATFASLGLGGARRVVDLWADRSAALGAREDVAYVLVFENRGPEVGATIAHPHGQIYAFDRVPPRVASEQRALDAVIADDGLVTTHGIWSAGIPHAATWPYELLIAPAIPVPDLPSLDGDQRDALAATLVEVFGALDRLFDEPMPYMFWFHQRPFTAAAWDGPPLHAHVAPINRGPGTPRFVAAGELGSGVFFNPVDPAAAAADLRRAVAGQGALRPASARGPGGDDDDG